VYKVIRLQIYFGSW